jgi:hypothetical protein
MPVSHWTEEPSSTMPARSASPDQPFVIMTRHPAVRGV